MLWRNRNQYVNVVRQRMPFENRALLLPREFMQERADCFSNVPEQRIASTLRYEHDMILAIPRGVGERLIQV